MAVETPDYVAMLCRMVRAAGRRIADGDPEDLALLLQVQAELDAAITAGVLGMRANTGRSWAEIGRALGVTKQAAAKRWGTPTPRPAVPEGPTLSCGGIARCGEPCPAGAVSSCPTCCPISVSRI